MPRGWRDAALLAAGAALLALYALAGWWPLGFVALGPWLVWVDRQRGVGARVLAGWLLAVLFTLAVFAWFGLAIGRYTQVGGAWGVVALLVLAPLFQPQWLAWVLVRQAVRARFGLGWGAVAGALAWVGVEWAAPKLLGDTLGHGLYPSEWLRQGAQLGGAALLTLLLLLVNEAGHAAWATRRWKPLALALLAPLLLAGHGGLVTRAVQAADAPPLRVGLVQANITDIEARRRAQGSGAALRELLDVHLAMSYDALERQKADVVLWSETVYPTTFGQPKSAAGAEMDAELLATIAAAGRPFVFGSYDRDAVGEYNAAAFVDPKQGLTGFYRKTRLFPLTEHVPPWLDGPWLRRLLPWVGGWQPGNGARPMPIRLQDGRELPVQALICRDDVDPQLALDAARLGAQALFTLSNDSWFDAHPVGARLHQAVAAFRSIETGLPQFRVTTSGFSSVIDAQGRVLATSGMGERALVVGSLPVGAGAPTLMLRLGDWVGPSALALLLLGVLSVAVPRRGAHAAASLPDTLPARLVLLPAPVRAAVVVLRLGARLALVALCLAWLLDEALRGQQLAQLRAFALAVLLPEAIAACLLAAFRVRAHLEGGALHLARGGQAQAWPLAQVASVRAWRLGWILPGASLRLCDGATLHLAGAEPAQLAQALALAGGPPAEGASAYQRARAAVAGGRGASAWLKFGLLPLLLALPAFHLHQSIAYGGLFGEWQAHGLRAWLLALGIWWAAWGFAVAGVAALLRVAVEAASWLTAWLQPTHAEAARRLLERLALLALSAGMPLWLALRVLGPG